MALTVEVQVPRNQPEVVTDDGLRFPSIFGADVTRDEWPFVLQLRIEVLGDARVICYAAEVRPKEGCESLSLLTALETAKVSELLGYITGLGYAQWNGGQSVDHSGPMVGDNLEAVRKTMPLQIAGMQAIRRARRQTVTDAFLRDEVAPVVTEAMRLGRPYRRAVEEHFQRGPSTAHRWLVRLKSLGILDKDIDQ